MKMEEVDSDAIHSIGYDPASMTMRVKFHSGSTYDYIGVSPEKHQHTIKADSVGRHFMKHVRPHHHATKV